MRPARRFAHPEPRSRLQAPGIHQLDCALIRGLANSALRQACAHGEPSLVCALGREARRSSVDASITRQALTRALRFPGIYFLEANLIRPSITRFRVSKPNVAAMACREVCGREKLSKVSAIMNCCHGRVLKRASILLTSLDITKEDRAGRIDSFFVRAEVSRSSGAEEMLRRCGSRRDVRALRCRDRHHARLG